MTESQITQALRQHLFNEGRCIAASKTGYCNRHPDHFVVFNAQIFTRSHRVLRQVDLDLTLDADKLNDAAHAVGQNFYVLHENDPTLFWKPGTTPVSWAVREAIWWTRFRFDDRDRFLPLASGPLWKRPARLRCTVGRWRGQSAYSVDLWTNPEWGSLNNYSGAVVQLAGLPPKGLRRVKEKGDLAARVSTSRGRTVKPLFYQRTGPLDYVWFNHGNAVPAILYDHSIRSLTEPTFMAHDEDDSPITMHVADRLAGLVWTCTISAPEVTPSAHAELMALRAVA
jgi:hypothetical protein